MATAGVPIIDRNNPAARIGRLHTRLGGDPRFWGLDSTEAQTKRFGNLASGATTLYSVPAGKRAIVRGGLVLLHNPTAGGITCDLHHVPSGGSAGSTNKMGPTKTVAVDELSTFAANRDLWHVMSGGDALVINTGGAGLNAWLVAIEEKDDIVTAASGFQGNLGTSEVNLLVVPALRTAAFANVLAFNPNGGSITLTVWCKSGSSAGADTDELVAQAIATNTVAHIDLSLLPTQGQDGRLSVKGSATTPGLNVWASALLL